MAEIAWWAWLGIGLFVAISAAWSGGKVSLFAWVGLAFIVIGIGKVIALFMLTPKESKTEQKMMHMRSPEFAHPPQTGFFCPRCRITLQPTDYFCRYCGQRLR